MNMSALLGLIGSLSFIAYIVSISPGVLSVLLDVHSLVIVGGGTFIATIISFPIVTVFRMMKLVLMRVLVREAPKHRLVFKEIVQLAKGYRDNPDFLSTNVRSLKTPFLRDAVELINDGKVPMEEIVLILRKRAATQYRGHLEDADIFRVIARFPPAFGLIGTVLGLVSLMRGMGGADSMKTIGSSMAIALTTTFYGIVISNLIFIPIAENLNKINKEDEAMRLMVVDGVRMLNDRVHYLLVEEHMKSYFMPQERKRIGRR